MRGFFCHVELHRQASDHTLEFSHAPPKEVVIVTRGPRSEAEPMLAVLRRTYAPNKVVALVSERERQMHDQLMPLVRQKTARKGRPTAYVCERGVCLGHPKEMFAENRNRLDGAHSRFHRFQFYLNI